jgi:hypothetical protein
VWVARTVNQEGGFQVLEYVRAVRAIHRIIHLLSLPSFLSFLSEEVEAEGFMLSLECFRVLMRSVSEEVFEAVLLLLLFVRKVDYRS